MFKRLRLVLLGIFTCTAIVCSSCSTMRSFYTIKLSTSEVTLDLDGQNEATVKATLSSLTGGAVTTGSILWDSNNSSIAKVNEGKITGVSTGKTSIVAKYSEDTKVYAVCNVTVIESKGTAIRLSSNSVMLDLENHKTQKLTATVENLKGGLTDEIVWSNQNDKIATFDDGLITALSIGETIITATLKGNPDIKATCKVSVKEEFSYDYTIMYYMCGSTLENESSSGGGGYPFLAAPTRAGSSSVSPGLMSDDIKEIISIKNLPDSVKIIIETGGSTGWALSKDYLDGATSISSSKLQRWEVSNNKLKLVETLDTNYMAKTESFQDFLSWGLEKYPATQMGVVLSGHGGGIGGVCYDDNYTYTYERYEYSYSLDTAQIGIAAKNALYTSEKDKFTWIGYDACLMAVADIATINADYFEYMVSSQEVEDGNGWDHTSYLNSIVENPSISPLELLPNITSSFIAQSDSSVCEKRNPCYAILSVLDLNKAGSLVAAFNEYCSGFTKSDYSNIVSAFKKAKMFGQDDGEYDYGLADFRNFVVKMESVFPTLDNQILLSAINDIVVDNQYCKYYTDSNKPCGLSIFVPEVYAPRGRQQYSLQVGKENYNTTNHTKFSTWQTLLLANGSFGW